MCSECGYDKEHPDCKNCGNTFDECDCGQYQPMGREDVEE